MRWSRQREQVVWGGLKKRRCVDVTWVRIRPFCPAYPRAAPQSPLVPPWQQHQHQHKVQFVPNTSPSCHLPCQVSRRQVAPAEGNNEPLARMTCLYCACEGDGGY